MLRIVFAFASCAILALSSGFQSSDLLKLRAVSSVQFSPDGTRLAYSITRSDGPRRPYGQLWIMTLADGKSTCLCSGNEPSGNLEWSPDGKWISYTGKLGDKSGLIVARANGSDAKYLGPIESTNAPLPSTGRSTAWSPGSKQIAYVSATPGPETGDASGDPVVITRYLYKPTASEGNTHFNDNKRMHIFVFDVASGKSRQLTNGIFYEHSIDWSPDGREIVYVSNRAKDDDRFFNYDLFTLDPSTGETRQLTATESAEYRPHYSPDGKSIAFEATTRGLTDRETTMEDTHVWLIDANGKNRREIGKELDARQGEPQFSTDGRWIYFTGQERGEVHLFRAAVTGGKPEAVVKERGSVMAFSTHGDAIAYALTTPSDQAELFLKSADGTVKQLTSVNREAMAGKTVEPVEAFTFISNDNKWTVEAFLTYPSDFRADKEYPLIVNIHGGPHGQQGPAFNSRNQIYASRGWATIMINYRGSTGYGQAFSDAIFADQDGNEGMDVLYGVNAALRRYPWIDANRLGIEGTSYGGQLSAWLITQTHMFKAAIPNAAITNIISYNYMTYYNQYEAMEWGAYPHQGNLMDVLWERSALKHVAKVVTPTMMVHGENDADVPIAEAEQYYIALKDVGVDTIMVRYPREGHGVRESHHNVDFIDRSIRWYEAHFPK